MDSKLLASLSEQVLILRFSFSQQNIRSMMFCFRYFGRLKSRGKPGWGLRGTARNGITAYIR